MAPLQTISCLSVLIVAIVFSIQPPPQAVTDYNEIRSSFRQFRSELQLKNGDAAAQLVSQSSVETYEQFRDLALDATAEELALFSIPQQLEVLQLRYLFNSKDLVGLSGRAVIAALIDRGKLNLPFVNNATLTEPVFQPPRCYLQIYDNQGAVKEKLTFVKEKEWRIDIPSMEYVHEKVYKSMMKKQELEPAELVEVIASSWDEDVDHLWTPLKLRDD